MSKGGEPKKPASCWGPPLLHDLLNSNHRPLAYEGAVIEALVQHHLDQVLRRALCYLDLSADEHMVYAVDHLRAHIQNGHILRANHALGDLAKTDSDLFGQVTGLHIDPLPAVYHIIFAIVCSLY